MQTVKSKVIGNIILAFLVLSILLLFMVGIKRCTPKWNKDRKFMSNEIVPGLYYEKYYVGLFDLDKFAIYLTDSLNFRTFIGIIGNKEALDFRIKEDTLTLRKWTWRISEITVNNGKMGENVRKDNDKLLWRKKYSLNTLRKGGVFE